MTTEADAQTKAAVAAARAREVLAQKIAKLSASVKDEAEAQVILHLAEAYGYLASEPPRSR